MLKKLSLLVLSLVMLTSLSFAQQAQVHQNIMVEIGDNVVVTVEDPDPIGVFDFELNPTISNGTAPWEVWQATIPLELTIQNTQDATAEVVTLLARLLGNTTLLTGWAIYIKMDNLYEAGTSVSTAPAQANTITTAVPLDGTAEAVFGGIPTPFSGSTNKVNQDSYIYIEVDGDGALTDLGSGVYIIEYTTQSA